MMIVVVIIGLSVSLVALSVGGTKDESATQKEADLYIRAIDFVSEESVLNGEVIGMFVEQKESSDSSAKTWCYHWQRFRDGNWIDMPEDTLTEHCMPENMQWDLTVEGRLYNYDPDLETHPPVLVFSPSGEATPVEMSIFESGSGSEAQHIDIDLMGSIHWRNREEAEKRDGL
jgi:general secretion pathway protein H